MTNEQMVLQTEKKTKSNGLKIMRNIVRFNTIPKTNHIKHEKILIAWFNSSLELLLHQLLNSHFNFRLINA